jgi:hypothetical protein
MTSVKIKDLEEQVKKRKKEVDADLKEILTPSTVDYGFELLYFFFGKETFKGSSQSNQQILQPVEIVTTQTHKKRSTETLENINKI